MAGFAHEISNPLSFVISNFETLAAYLSIFKEIIREINYVSMNRNKNDLDIFSRLWNLGKIADKLDFMYDDIDNLLTETQIGIERIKNIVDSVRNFAWIENEENFREIDLNACIDRALLLSKNEIQNVAFVEKEYTDPLVLEGNFDQLVQALLNLILNAVHAIKSKQLDKPGLIKIRTYSDGEYAYCEITDNGIGIPKKNLESVFDVFFTTKSFGFGTGLGLSIVKYIISEKHNGDVFVDSEQGVGSTFTVKLPLRQKGY